ncbi:hypothetical protein DFH06DRAFT_1064361 [Mycena polygramma]|nr:hypothetical protein DFH06DRAFT_1064361 [Mycena polygramma]
MSSTETVVLPAANKTFAYTFPPFPSVPQGVTIVPFKKFTEYGTRVIGKDGIERDGLGIATIALPPKKPKVKMVSGSSLKKEWWHDWEALGEPRRGPYDPNLNPADRLYQSATEFSKRYGAESNEHLQKIWIAFRNYIGLRTKGVAAEEEVSDDEYEESGPPNQEPAVVDMAPAVVNMAPASVQFVDETLQTEKEKKTAAFLNNPAKSFEIFLSSHMYETGLMWSPYNLVSTPHLLRFFVKFLLLNKVLREHTQSLQDSLKLIDLAGKELSLIPRISNALPDAFSEACQSHWGCKADDFPQSDPEDTESVSDEPKAKRAKLDHEAEEHIEEITTDGAAALETVPGAQDVDMKDVAQDGGWGAGGGWGKADDAKMDTGSDGGGWDSGAGWGDAWGKSNPVANEPTALTPAKLETAPRPTLLTLLGPSAFPLTHTPGIVEWSVRRIKSVSAPLQNYVPQGIGAEAIERELEARMHRVVLEPWVGVYPAAVPPHILGCSVGALAPAVAASPEQPKPHDVLKDEITVLVEPETAKFMCRGMGLGGRWVQLARVQDREPVVTTNVVPDDKKKLSKTQKARRRLRYWYIDEHVMTVPSYWVV